MIDESIRRPAGQLTGDATGRLHSQSCPLRHVNNMPSNKNIQCDSGTKTEPLCKSQQSKSHLIPTTQNLLSSPSLTFQHTVSLVESMTNYTSSI